MSHRVRRTVFACAALILALLGSAGCGQSAADSSDNAKSDPDTLTLTFIPGEENRNLDEQFAKVTEIIEAETGKHVEYHQATSYAAAIEAQRAGKAQIAGYGPFSYILAKDGGAKVELLAYSADSPDDPGGYHSVLSVRQDSTIKDVKDLEGKTVCFVDPSSTSGYLFPTAAIMKAGLDPKKDITPVFAGSHDASVLSLVDGQCDAAFSTESMAKEQLVDSGQIPPDSIKQIWTSDLIPPSPLAISTTLSKDLRDQLKKIFLDELNVDALEAAGRCDEDKENCGLPTAWGYLPIEDSDYDVIRAVCDTTKADACESGEG